MSAKTKVVTVLSPFLFGWGMFCFWIIRRVPRLGMVGYRSFFVLTNGGISNFTSKIISTFRRPYKNIDYKDQLAVLTDQSLEDVVDQINKDGYFIFEKQLPAEVVDEVVRYSKETKTNYLVTGKAKIEYSKEGVLMDFENPISPRYQFNDQEISQYKGIQNFLFDKGLLAVANSYLKTKPILDRLAMWWSVPFDNKETANAAQMYHFDLPRLKWIKFFFYLTDVDDNNGPHCYVKGSHRGVPKSVRRDGRLNNDEVKAAFGEDAMLEIKGKRGTIIAADSRGLHKGKPLTDGSRLMFQLEYCNSLFGGSYQSYETKGVSDEHKELKSKYSSAFKLFKA